MRASTFGIIPENTFRVHTLDRPEGDWLSFSDSIYFTYHKDVIVYDGDANVFSVSTEPVQSALENKENIMFKMTPQIKGYYCQDGQCLDFNLNQAKGDNYSSTYNGQPVYRQPNCWDFCKPAQKSHFREVWYSLLIVVLICISLAVIGKFYLRPTS
jgi:hypothetical protein